MDEENPNKTLKKGAASEKPKISLPNFTMKFSWYVHKQFSDARNI